MFKVGTLVVFTAYVLYLSQRSPLGFCFFFISIDKTNTIKAINRILSLPSPILVFAGFINLKVQGREGGDGLCA